jgi:hypothetical protein
VADPLPAHFHKSDPLPPDHDSADAGEKQFRHCRSDSVSARPRVRDNARRVNDRSAARRTLFPRIPSNAQAVG